MINIENKEFFGYKSYVAGDLTLINIMVDPEMVELKTYKRTPFASIIIRGDTKLPLDDKGKIFDEIEKLSLTCSMKAYNLYKDDEYDQLQKNFPDVTCHTIIFYIDTSDSKCDDSSYFVISAIPIRGIVTPFGKSQCFQLLNGSFINCKPFKSQIPVNHKNWEEPDQYYNKIVYTLADIKSKFDFQEYITTNDSMFGVMIDHSYTIDVMYRRITSSEMRYFIPVEGRDHLFSKPAKNIFYLSDVPKNIMTKSDTMIVKM